MFNLSFIEVVSAKLPTTYLFALKYATYFLQLFFKTFVFIDLSKKLGNIGVASIQLILLSTFFR